MILTLLLQTSTPNPSVEVPQQSYILTARGSLGRPQEPEEEEKRRSVATPVQMMTRTEKYPPTHIAMHGQSNKNTLVNT